jgi:hypothetical protein
MSTKEKEPERIRLSDLQKKDGDGKGLACRKCGCCHFRVVYTRPALGAIRRLRECRHCGRRVMTTERC